MDEILYELREHAAGLNAGRWDYLFSLHQEVPRPRRPRSLPDRAQLTMTTPFMRAYTKLLVATCHRRGAHAIGGMAAFIPSRRDAEVNATAMAKVRDDKERESGDGFDGTWVAHPDLVPLATEIFDGVLGDRPNQKDRLRDDVAVERHGAAGPRASTAARSPRPAYRPNVSVALQYLDAWLSGNGAAAINNLMEDAATAEISRSQLWQWRTSGARLDDGREASADLYRAVRDEELAALGGPDGGAGRLARRGGAPRRARPRRRVRRVPDAPRLLAPRLTAADVDPAVIEMVDRSMVDFYVQGRRRPWADIKIDDDVVWGATGLPLQAFNGAVGATFSESTADARIETVLDYYRELKLDMSWWVGPTSPAWLGDRLVAHGLGPGRDRAGAGRVARWLVGAAAAGRSLDRGRRRRGRVPRRDGRDVRGVRDAARGPAALRGAVPGLLGRTGLDATDLRRAARRPAGRDVARLRARRASSRSTTSRPCPLRGGAAPAPR